MTTFTAARTQTISSYKDYRAAHPEGNLLTFVEDLRATLATVRPNPDDAAQVETVARALCRSEGDGGVRCVAHSYDDGWYLNDGACEFGRQRARAVLTALAEAVGRG